MGAYAGDEEAGSGGRGKKRVVVVRGGRRRRRRQEAIETNVPSFPFLTGRKVFYHQGKGKGNEKEMIYV